MQYKTIVTAEVDKQEILITRTFDLPVNLLFKAHTEVALLEQWMGNKVLKFENKAHGSFQFETKDVHGNTLFRANGCIHSINENQNITRTFEMENAFFPPQLEFLDFEQIDEVSSKLKMKIIFKSVEDRDNMLKLPFELGINMAHKLLQNVMNQFN